MFQFSQPSFAPPESFAGKYRALKEMGILGALEIRSSFDDDPQFYTFTCEYLSPIPGLGLRLGYGAGIEPESAIVRAVAEATEYYCLASAKQHPMIYASYNDLGSTALDLRRISGFTNKQLSQAKFAPFRYSNDSKLNWVLAKSLFDNSSIYVPAQLVFAPYDCHENEEPIFRFPISTGAACEITQEAALLNGINEIIERDAYMINYLNFTCRHQINILGSVCKIADSG